MMFKVKVRATGQERTVTQAAYAAKGPKVYEKLGVVNDDGSETASSPNPNSPQVSRSVRGAAPVVVKQIEVPRPAIINPEPENVTQPEAAQEQTQPVVREKKKPGPKRKETISSNATTDEK
jgi:hypothetical protein